MLPGFRFLFAAILLSVSMLVFGVGAAALLRATHEQFVANPSWRNGPQEQVFAQSSEPAQPVLAAFRAEPVATETAPSLRDRVPTIGLPANDAEPAAVATSGGGNEPAVQLADTRPTEAAADEPAKVETTVAPPADVVAAPPAAAEAAPTVAESQPVSTTGPATPPSTPVAASAAQPADPIVAPAPSDAAAKAAALTDPATITNKAPPAKAKATSAAPDAAAKRRAQQSKKRHPVARRPPPPPPPVQQTFDPFAPQQPLLATTATRTR